MLLFLIELFSNYKIKKIRPLLKILRSDCLHYAGCRGRRQEEEEGGGRGRGGRGGED